jgi:hypothetical protein
LYADVNRQVRALVAAGTVDPEAQAGTVQQARTLAAAIDRASGLGGRKQETYALSPMHKQLDELLARLSGTPVDAPPGLVEILAALAAADPPTVEP